MRVAGSLREAQDQVPKGGLWIVEAQDSEAVHSLLKTDPFWTCGLRERVEVLIWRKAFDHAHTRPKTAAKQVWMAWLQAF